MREVAISGGRQRRTAGVRDRDHRPLYDLAVLLAWGPDGARELLRYRTPDAPDTVGHRFGAMGRDGDQLWLCTERDVLRWPDGARRDRTAFADLHHVAPTPDGILAVATGVGGVVRVDDGRFWPVHPGAVAPTSDVRWVPTHDPTHPNHVFGWRGRTWVTRGVSGDVVPLAGGAPIPVADVVIHDGVPTPDGVWFTAVDGRLVLVDLERGPVHTVQVRADGDEPLGWCRGLWVDGDRAWVGFTRLRATRLRKNLAWLAGRLRGRTVAGRRPTRVCEVDLGTGEVLRELVTEPLGLDAVFGVQGLD